MPVRFGFANKDPMQPDDAITPVQIEHSIDEVWIGEELDQYYNYLDYHFEEGGIYLRARVYLDDPRTATLFGPFESRQSSKVVTAPSIREAVEAYLGRRFHKVVQR
ncbi:MAG: hypothetical protein ABT11_12740 [Novosphingobium sp. SCN 66-18]|nr:MAG: hypothetical protein ABT11_12740 [Novosphingobium sp. SCN 66-18]